MEEFRGLCVFFWCEMYVFCNFSVDWGVWVFVEKIGVGLIGIFNYYCYLLWCMFSGSNVEVLVNYFDIFVLSVDYMDEIDMLVLIERK